jgi:large repetitive protein
METGMERAASRSGRGLAYAPIEPGPERAEWTRTRAARTLAGARGPSSREGMVVPRRPRSHVAGSLRQPARRIAVGVAGLIVVAGTLTSFGLAGIGVAPAADSTLSCTDQWTGGGGTTDWDTPANWSTGVPDETSVDVCIAAGATVVVARGSFAVGELTVSRGSALTVGAAPGDSGPTGATLAVVAGAENDGILTAEPSATGAASLTLDGPITNTGTLEADGSVVIGHAAASTLVNSGTVGVAPGSVVDLESSSTATSTPSGLLAFGIDGPASSASNYGSITNGSLSLGGSADSVFDDGFTPSPGSEYAVYHGSYSGTFAAVGNDARADYSQPSDVGLVGGAPPEATAVALTSSVPSAVFGQEVQFTATVTPSSGSDPTGSVTFRAGALALGSATLTGTEGVTSATLETSSLPVGSQAVTATYGGDVVFGASTSRSFAQIVIPDSSDLTVAASPTSAVPGQPVSYTVAVSAAAPGAGTPTGTISLTDDGTPVAGCQSLVLAPPSPQVTCDETYASDATHTVAAAYGGDAGFSSSTAALTEAVSPLSTTTSVAASARTSTFGQSVTLTAVVAPTAGTAGPPGDPSPTGAVTFTDNGATLGASTLTATGAVTTTSMLVTTLPLGPNAVAASYGGDTDFAASSAAAVASVTVSQAPTNLGLGSSLNPALSGQPVTFTASVFPATGSGETGTVTFFVGGTALGSASVSNGEATLTTSALPAGTDPVTARYGGDGSFAGSATPGPWSQEVDAPAG